MKLNKDKVKWAQSIIPFVRQKLIPESFKPEDVNALKHFLGMVNFLFKRIIVLHLRKVTELLCRLEDNEHYIHHCREVPEESQSFNATT